MSNISIGQEVLVENISSISGRKYFEETTTSQPSLVFCGYWSGTCRISKILQIGDSLTQYGFLNNKPFNGVALDYDSLGNLIGKYLFKDGLIQKVEEFSPDGKSKLLMNLKNGIPHGVHKDFDWEGELRILKTFENGVLNGPFYQSKERIDYGLPPCIEKGTYKMGIYHQISNSCAGE
jgi:hypothetical protein